MSRLKRALFAASLVLGFVACVLPNYTLDPVGVAGSSGASAGTTAIGGGATGGGESSVGGAGSAGLSQAGAAGSGSLTCDSGKKVCGDTCVSTDDPAFGCTLTSCSQSACPAGGASLACEAGKCVIGACPSGMKKCDGKCVSQSDPTYGCGSTSCAATSCPDPGDGTIICSGTSCVVGTCPSQTKKCGSKCVPLDATNGCAGSSCAPCASNEVCTASSSSCTCVPDNVEACKGLACGSAVNNCGEGVKCTDTCTAPNTCGGGNVGANSCGCSDLTACNGKACGDVVDKCNVTVSCFNTCDASAPLCVSNQCKQCNAASDCPSENPCAKATCTNHTCGYTTVAAGTSCPAGGTCSTTSVGICTRSMISVGAYSIDATPVTRGAYQAFVIAKNGNVAGQQTACSTNTTYVPPMDYPPAVKDLDKPAGYVDWCDAKAYCLWAGKRLCGRIGGAQSAWYPTDPTIDEWMHACVGPNTTTYPYGNTFDASKCNASGTPEPVGTHAGCMGGYNKLYDMTGNVLEWEDQLQGTGTAADPYQTELHGNGYAPDSSGAASATRCDHQWGHTIDRLDPSVGFRCCDTP